MLAVVGQQPPPETRIWAGIMLVLLALDVACTWFLARRRAFHDWLLRTEVVLESSEEAVMPSVSPIAPRTGAVASQTIRPRRRSSDS